MIRYTLEDIKNKSKKYENVVLFGAGSAGVELSSFLRNNNVNVAFFYDNDEKNIGKTINGIEIVRAYKQKGKCLYIIAIKSDKAIEIINKQLLNLDINEMDIVVLNYIKRTYDYMINLNKDEYKSELSKMYFETFNKELNWENPQTYNEKINCKKLTNDTEEITRLVDKYLVREWIEKKIGKDYLTQIYGVWDNVEDIDFDSLPEKFVLKLNNGSGRNIIIIDKSQINVDEIKSQINKWKKENFALNGLELQYMNIVPKIICEEYLEGVAEGLYDYDIYCFHGNPKYIWCINGSHRKNCKASFYNTDWEMQEFSYGYPKDYELAPKPFFLNEMLELSKILCKDFEHARIDWYEYPKSKHGFLFSEITFSTWSGLKHFYPEKWDKIFGDLI